MNLSIELQESITVLPVKKQLSIETTYNHYNFNELEVEVEPLINTESINVEPLLLKVFVER